MNIDFTPEYYRNMKLATEQFEESIIQNWRDEVSKTFLELIKSNYFQPLLECAQKLDKINDREQLIVQYCYLVGEKLFSKTNDDCSADDNSEDKSDKNVSNRDEKLRALFTTREDIELERLKADVYNVINTIYSGQANISEGGGFGLESQNEEKELVRTRVKNN